LSRNLAFLTNAWNEVKVAAGMVMLAVGAALLSSGSSMVTRRAKSGTLFVQSTRRKFVINSARAEANREMGRRYIQPIVNNR